MQTSMRPTFAKFSRDFASTNSRLSVASVSLHVHVLSTWDTWLVLGSFVLTLRRSRLWLIGLHLKMLRGFSNFLDLLITTTDSYVALHVWLLPLVTFCQPRMSLCGGRNSSRLLNS